MVIVADEHQRAALSCAGHPLVETPHLDALATDVNAHHSLFHRLGLVRLGILRKVRGSGLGHLVEQALTEVSDFIADGNIELDGDLPINTNGGQLGEAYIHGMNGIAEAVRQLRSTAVNQVPDVTNVLVTAGSGVPTSGLILSNES